MPHGSSVLSRRRLAAVVCTVCVVLTGCGEESDVFIPEVTPAQLIDASTASGGHGPYGFGEEIRLTFDRDPGVVEVGHRGVGQDIPHKGSGLRSGVVGEGTLRAFLVRAHFAHLTWDHGGAVMLTFAPLLIGQAEPPAVRAVFPENGAEGVSVAKLMARGVVLDADRPFHPDNRMIPVLQTSEPTITASDGRSWHPEVVTKRDKLTLVSDPDNPFLSGQTYVVLIDIWGTDWTIERAYRRFEFSTESP